MVSQGDAVYFGSKNGVSRFDRGGGTTPNGAWLPGTLVEGLAIYNGELYLSDTTNNRVRVYALDGMKEQRSWAMTRPGRIAVTPAGEVWVIQFAPDANPANGEYDGARVLAFSTTGVPGAVISDVVNPQAICADKKGRVLIGGLDPASQVRIYRAAKLVSTFGERVVVLAADKKNEVGTYGPLRFHWIKGLGVDDAGNIYVACNYGPGWGQSVAAYAPSGARK